MNPKASLRCHLLWNIVVVAVVGVAATFGPGQSVNLPVEPVDNSPQAKLPAANAADKLADPVTTWMDVLRQPDSDKVLVLVRRAPLYPVTLADLIKVLSDPKHPLNRTANVRSLTDNRGSMGFLVLASALEGLEGGVPTVKPPERVVGMVYAYHETAFHPLPVYSGRLVWHHPRETIYLVLCRSRGENLTLAIFPVDPKNNIGKPTLKFDPFKVEDWPDPLKPVTELKTKLKLNFFIPMRDISTVPDRDSLLITVLPPQAKHEPLYFRYDFAKDTWTREKVAVKDLIKKDKN